MNFKEKSQRSNGHNDLFLVLRGGCTAIGYFKVPGESNLKEKAIKEQEKDRLERWMVVGHIPVTSSMAVAKKGMISIDLKDPA